MDIRKGNAVTHSRQTVDTDLHGMLYTKGHTESSAVRKKIIPPRSPEIQQNARTRQVALRNTDDCSKQKYHATQTIPLQDKTRKQTCLCKRLGCTRYKYKNT